MAHASGYSSPRECGVASRKYQFPEHFKAGGVTIPPVFSALGRACHVVSDIGDSFVTATVLRFPKRPLVTQQAARGLATLVAHDDSVRVLADDEYADIELIFRTLARRPAPTPDAAPIRPHDGKRAALELPAGYEAGPGGDLVSCARTERYRLSCGEGFIQSRGERDHHDGHAP
jgi:hypothetical protein